MVKVWARNQIPSFTTGSIIKINTLCAERFLEGSRCVFKQRVFLSNTFNSQIQFIACLNCDNSFSPGSGQTGTGSFARRLCHGVKSGHCILGMHLIHIRARPVRLHSTQHYLFIRMISDDYPDNLISPVIYLTSLLEIESITHADILSCKKP